MEPVTNFYPSGKTATDNNALFPKIFLGENEKKIRLSLFFFFEGLSDTA